MKLFLKALPVMFVLIISTQLFSQEEITPVIPADGASDINVGIIKWNGTEGNTYDIYFGLTENPELYKSNLQVCEEKPVLLELNKKYYWRVVEKKDDKELRTSKIFSFSTLPIELNPAVEYKPCVDTRDYKIYWTVTINGNEWFAHNLDFEEQGFSYYYNDDESKKVYGKLYTGTALNDNSVKLCPEGWHIPTLAEWEDLLNSFGGYKNAGKDLKESSDNFWRESKKNERTNKSGMTILPSGSRDSKPSYSNLGKYSMFWTSTKSPKVKEGFMTVDFGFMRDNAINEHGDLNWGYSIRCVRNKK